MAALTLPYSPDASLRDDNVDTMYTIWTAGTDIFPKNKPQQKLNRSKQVRKCEHCKPKLLVTATVSPDSVGWSTILEGLTSRMAGNHKKRMPSVNEWKMHSVTNAQVFFQKPAPAPYPRKLLRHLLIHPSNHLSVKHVFIHSPLIYRDPSTYQQYTASRDSGALANKWRSRFCLLRSYDYVEEPRSYLNNHTNREFRNCDKMY